MSKSTSRNKPTAFAVSAALAGGIALAGSAFAMQPMAQGYLLSAGETAKAAKVAEGKCGEGKCGVAKADTDKDGKVSQAEFAAAHPDMADKFAGVDTNSDGFIDDAEMKARGEGKCGEGKCGAEKKDKAAHEGKCGEGKCGGTA